MVNLALIHRLQTEGDPLSIPGKRAPVLLRWIKLKLSRHVAETQGIDKSKVR